jgi:hypothetical protein
MAFRKWACNLAFTRTSNRRLDQFKWPVYVYVVHHWRVKNTFQILDSVSISRLALSIGPNWVGFTWRRRQDPVSEMFLNKTGRCFRQKRTMDNVQKYNMCINAPSSQTFRCYLNNESHPLFKSLNKTIKWESPLISYSAYVA